MPTTKQDVLRDNFSCLNRASYDEPVFVLRARDPLAAQTVRLWASMAADVHPPEQVSEAFSIASEFEDWRCAHVPQPVCEPVAKTRSSFDEAVASKKARGGPFG